MENYSETFAKATNNLNDTKKAIMDSIVNLFKTIQLKPLVIGNMVYFYTKENGEDVPSYNYLIDYKRDGKFYPIYDRYENHYFGWIDFSSCCKIFDVIRKEIEKKS